MSSHPLRRYATALFAVAIVAGSTFFVSATPASAATQPSITLSQDHPIFDKEFGTVPGGWIILGQALTPTPDGCGNKEGVSDTSNPPQDTTFCDRIALHVKPPKLGPADDYFVTLTLSWQDPAGNDCSKNHIIPASVEGMVPVGGIPDTLCLDDFDLYMWDNGQIDERQNPQNHKSPSDQPVYTREATAATFDDPEIVRLGDPNLDTYNLLVINNRAPSTYHLKAEMKILPADKVFELLSQVPKLTPPGTTNVAPSSVDLSAPPPDNLLTAPAGVAAVPISGDSSFDLGVNPPTLAQQILAPPQAIAPLTEPKPGPASGLALVLWLVAVPIGLLGGSLLVAWRRGMLGAGNL